MIINKIKTGEGKGKKLQHAYIWDINSKNQLRGGGRFIEMLNIHLCAFGKFIIVSFH